ncbi:hypothetical protein OpiT1DRAFT_01823 [Opitutaceae bacterium TAV1]|nr:hypothetical protein OpiT1DRAFT_01823 [Opitutaceae bacterium TAV1]
MKIHPPFLLIVAIVMMAAFATTPVQARILLIDQRPAAKAEYRTLAAAAAAVQPGDAIKIAPGSGPYREMLYIRTSGTPEKPITIDGAGEVLTGADPLVPFVKNGDTWTADLTPYHTTTQHVQGFNRTDGRWASKFTPAPVPFVLIYRGERLRQDRVTGQFTRYATLSADQNTLALLPGVSPDDWEISVRPYVVRTTDATSHHIYHHIRATGSLNDGFNMHGSGQGLVFEDIEAFNNLDEGFSAHDTVSCTLSRGRFHNNDNGLTNANQSVMRAVDVVCHDNLGFGFYLQIATADVDNLDCARNGVAQLVLHMGATLNAMGRITLTPAPWRDNLWVSSQESGQNLRAMTINKGSRITLTGNEPILLAP